LWLQLQYEKALVVLQKFASGGLRGSITLDGLAGMVNYEVLAPASYV
jgi:hypothetical protein